MDAILATFLQTLPSIVGALLLLVIGWIVAGFVGGLVARLLRKVGVDQLATKAGITAFLQRARLKLDAAGLVGGIVTWYVRLIFVVMAANAVGITAVSEVLSQIIAFIPNLLVALLILGAFAWLAGVTRNLVTGATESAGVPNSGALATLAYATVLGFGIVAAASQIGVAATLINIMFTGIIAAVALAFGLAFGLGGREEAARVLRDWRGQAASAREHLETSPTSSPHDGHPESLIEERMRRDELMRKS
ncbi:MAG TPA: small-conductance mechanosensitive ion channel [Candidatus Limnocylindria bacterium]|nr:small-conductance mechanosensitive ion channel [Candidatus Limnocylindria bacterium]